jgi:hypothetical protein
MSFKKKTSFLVPVDSLIGGRQKQQRPHDAFQRQHCAWNIKKNNSNVIWYMYIRHSRHDAGGKLSSSYCNTEHVL